MKNTINILCAADNKYIPYCGIMLTSVFENNKDVKDGRDDSNIFNVGAEFKLKDISLAAAYAKNSADKKTADADYYKDNGFYIDLKYKGAQAAKPGSWGLQAKYYHWGDGVCMAHGWDNLFEPITNGFKGYKLAANYAVAKNMIAEVIWWDTKDLKDDTKTRTIWTAMHINF